MTRGHVLMKTKPTAGGNFGFRERQEKHSVGAHDENGLSEHPAPMRDSAKLFEIRDSRSAA